MISITDFTAMNRSSIDGLESDNQEWAWTRDRKLSSVVLVENDGESRSLPYSLRESSKICVAYVV